ncbi:MAG TPA: N-acetylmuramoyl-L-alanine amidase [Tepidisphaeraceae bacterium]|jgi:N-acetylmuramoyl-L-alanine amidase|nr:N-acetylmuramoyl-L-alanine amidase [Tepidisphaeraceae bacterium]
MTSRLIACGVVVLTVVGCTHKAHPPSTQPITEEKLSPPSLDDAMALIDHRDDWATLPQQSVPRHPAEKFLKDMTIVLDPGHGGSENGATATVPDGKGGKITVREADANFRVARLLERLLRDAGVNVIMTRYGDDQMSLADRAEVANRAVRVDGKIGADLFISIHHNSASSNPKTNYTTIWYHGQIDDAEPAIDIAKCVAHHLGDQIHSNVAVTAALMSDQLMYEGGFGVLRAARMPSFLCECSFITGATERERLRDATYNLREAYGIYLGLCEYAYDGRPTQTLPEVTLSSSNITITSILSEVLPDWWGKDRSRIFASTVQTRFDGNPVPTDFDPRTKKLTATLPISPQDARLRNKPLVFELHFENMFKHHNYPQRFEVKIDPAGPKATVEPLGPAPIASTRPATAPATGAANSRTAR